MTGDSGDVRETFRLLALPDLRDWLRRHRTGPDTYPLAGYHRFVAATAEAYLAGWGCSAPLTPRAQEMLDGIYVAAADAVVVEAGRSRAPLDGYTRAIAAKYAVGR